MGKLEVKLCDCDGPCWEPGHIKPLRRWELNPAFRMEKLDLLTAIAHVEEAERQLAYAEKVLKEAIITNDGGVMCVNGAIR